MPADGYRLVDPPQDIPYDRPARGLYLFGLALDPVVVDLVDPAGRLLQRQPVVHRAEQAGIVGRDLIHDGQLDDRTWHDDGEQGIENRPGCTLFGRIDDGNGAFSTALEELALLLV